jgi:hypothetical protein
VITAWIVITLMLALVVGVIAWGLMHNDFGGFAFIWGFAVTCQVSFVIAVIYVAAHFIGLYW